MAIYIHLKDDLHGMYKVATYGASGIKLVMRDRTTRIIPCSQFERFAGGEWNSHLTCVERNDFLRIVAPNQLAQEIQERVDYINALKTPVVDYSEELEETKEKLQEAERKLSSMEWSYNMKTRRLKQIDANMKNIYKNFPEMKVHEDIQIKNGRKFIIMKDYRDNTYHFYYDPYMLLDNYHRELEKVFKVNYNQRVEGGGWIKIIDNTVYLYSKSGDFGSYDSKVAIATAKNLFKNKVIKSYSNAEWDDNWIEDDGLPF